MEIKEEYTIRARRVGRIRMLRLDSLVLAIVAVAVLGTAPAAAIRVKHIDGLVGVHFDLEPHTLSQWTANWTSVAVQYLDLLHKLHDLTWPAGLYLAVDLNPSYDGGQCGGCVLEYRGVSQTLMRHVVEIVDEICVMDYVNVGSLVAAVQNEVDAAQQLKKSVVLALNFISSGPVSETLWDDGVAVLESSLEMLYNEFRVNQGKTALRGTAVHTYGYYRSVDPAPVAPAPARMRDLYWWSSPNVTTNIYNGADRQWVMNFSTSHAVAQLYVDAPAIVALTPPSYDQNLLTTFIGSLKNLSISSQLIFGDATWCLSANHDQAVAKVTATITYVGAYGVMTDLPNFDSPATTAAATTTSDASSTASASSGSTLGEPLLGWL